MRAVNLGLLAAIAFLVVVASCGARSSLDLLALDASVDAKHDAHHDATPDVVVEAGPDVVDGSPCESGADCMDSNYCNVGTCDPERGCVFAPRDCDDGLACTNDGCDEDKKACTHVPDDMLCPNTELCSATRGCASFVYGSASDGHLYEVNVPSGQLVDVGDSPAFASDIALAPDGTLYATDSYILYKADRALATTTAVGSIMPLHQYNGLGTNPQGQLVATADVPTIFQIDATSAAATAAGFLPAGFRASGDLTTIPIPAGSMSELVVTLTSSTQQSNDSLALVTPNGQATILGDTGFTCVWGLATLGTNLYGLTCQGLLIQIDPDTGQGTMLAQATPAFFGAAGR